jgi:lysine biosynthesis protein LysW
MVTAFCLDCGYSVSLGPQATEGQMITCPNCDAQLEVINLDPLELDWAYLEPIMDDEKWEQMCYENMSTLQGTC